MTSDEYESIGFDVSLSRAVIIGSSTFSKDPENLVPLSSVVCNVIDLERVLLDPALIGLPGNHVIRLLDETSITEVQEAVASACSEASDLLLIYYSGHGLISRKGELLLALPTSTLANSAANCVHWDILKGFIAGSSARNKLVILDCCFSGRALELMGPEDEAIRSRLGTKGTVVLTSSARNEPSLAPSGERRTAFTGAFLGLVENGLDNGRPVLSVNEIFAAAQQNLLSRGFPEPKIVNYENAHDLAWTRNRKTLGADATTIAATDAIFRNLERKISNYVEARLPARPAAETNEFLEEPISPVRSFIFTVIMLVFAFLETIFLLYLGAHRDPSSSSSTAKSYFPRIAGFIVTSVALFSFSILVAVGAFTSLAKDWRNTPFYAFTSNPRWARRIAAWAGFNAFLVFIVAMIAASVEVFYVYR